MLLDCDEEVYVNDSCDEECSNEGDEGIMPNDYIINIRRSLGIYVGKDKGNFVNDLT